MVEPGPSSESKEGGSAPIEALSGWAGRVSAWSIGLMVALGGFNALARYFDRDLGTRWSSNRWVEAQWYLFSVAFLLGAAETLRRGAHVRVDVLYGRLGPRWRARIDLFGALCLLLPFCAFALWMSWPAAWNSWSIKEGSPDPGGLPRYPIKFLVPLAFGLLLLQGLSEVKKSLRQVQGEPRAPKDSR